MKGSTETALRTTVSIPGSGSRLSSRGANRRARWAGSRLGRLTPMRALSSVSSARIMANSSCRAPRPAASSLRVEREQQPFEGGGHALRRADRLGIMLAHAVVRRRRQRRDALRRNAEDPVQPLQHAGGPAGREAVGDGGAGQGHEVADRGDAEARQGLGVRVAQAQGGGGQGLQPVGLRAGGNDGNAGDRRSAPRPGRRPAYRRLRNGR